MNPLPGLLALAVLAAPVAAQPKSPFAGGVDAAKVAAVFAFTLPPGADLDTEVGLVDEFYGETIFPAGATQCVAAATALSKPAQIDGQQPWVEFMSEAYVLTRSGGASFKVYRFWVASSAKGRHAKDKALGKLKAWQDRLTKAIAEAPRCR